MKRGCIYSLLVAGMLSASCGGCGAVHDWVLEARIERMIGAGDIKGALRLYESCKPAPELSARVHLLLEDGYLGVDDNLHVVEQGRLALVKDPLNEKAARFLIFGYRKLGRSEEALPLVTSWLAKNRGGAEIYKDMALVFGDLGRVKEALECSSMAIEKCPNSTRVAAIHAYFVARVDGWAKSWEFVQHWASGHTVEPFFWMQVAKGAGDEGEHEEAAKLYRMVLSENANSVEASRLLMQSLRELGQLDNAEAHAQGWSETNQGDADWWNVRGACLYDDGHYVQALECFQKSFGLDEGQAKAASNLIICLNELQRQKETLVVGRNWMQAHPEEAEASFLTAMGNACLREHLSVEGSGYFAAALKLTPDDPELVYGLGRLLHEAGDHRQALKTVDDWLSGHPTAEAQNLRELQVTLRGAVGHEAEAPLSERKA